MENIELKKGIVKENLSRDIYSQKSYVEHIPLSHLLKKIIVITSYEYITRTLEIESNEFKKISDWINEQTEKLFEDYKSNPDNFPGDVIVGIFFLEPVTDIDLFIESEI